MACLIPRMHVSGRKVKIAMFVISAPGQTKAKPTRYCTTTVHRSIVVLCLSCILKDSRTAFVNTSTIANCESRPNVNSIMKNNIENNGPTGICANASGYMI